MSNQISSGLRRTAAIVLALALTAGQALAAGNYTTSARVNVRADASAGAAVVTTLAKGAAVEVIEYKAGSWSRVSVNGSDGYIKSEFLAEAAPVEQAAPSATYTTTSAVNLRAGASTGDKVLKKLVSGAVVEVSEYNPSGWSKVFSGEVCGYVKSEYLKPKTASAAVASVLSAPSASGYRTTARVNFRAAASQDAAVLRTLSAGTSVEAVETANGWTKAVVGDKTGYIKSEYLAEAGQYVFSLAGGVELTPWSEAKKIFKTYTPAQIYDVRSGAVYYVQSFSNGSHADVEPLTKEDTAIMYKTFGNDWSWDVRPVWVTINGHTMAASINGQPHGGGVIADNGMDGQICIHFKGSTTHNGNKRFAKLHQDVVLEAWNAR